MPVTMLRDSDGKMRLGGSNAARLQPHHPVDERGRMHGVPELSAFAEQRIAAKIRVEFTNAKEKRRWGTRRAKRSRLRRQDKSRTLLGCRMGRKSRNNNVRGKGAHGSITLLNAIIRWEVCELHALRINAP
jgi:hypothetical protein